MKIPGATYEKWRAERSDGDWQRPFRFRDGVTILATLVVLVPQDGPEKLPLTDVWKQKVSEWPKLGTYGYSPLQWNLEVGPNKRNYGSLTPNRPELFESATGSSYASVLRHGTYRVGALVRFAQITTSVHGKRMFETQSTNFQRPR